MATFPSKIYVGGPSLFKGAKEEHKNTVHGRINANSLYGNILLIYPRMSTFISQIYPEVITQNMQSYALRFYHIIYRRGKLETPKSSTLEEWINYDTPCINSLKLTWKE